MEITSDKGLREHRLKCFEAKRKVAAAAKRLAELDAAPAYVKATREHQHERDQAMLAVTGGAWADGQLRSHPPTGAGFAEFFAAADYERRAMAPVVRALEVALQSLPSELHRPFREALAAMANRQDVLNRLQAEATRRLVEEPWPSLPRGCVLFERRGTPPQTDLSAFGTPAAAFA
ncbi:MAG: hypothetical protein DCC67_11500 [Planctomycetota bacterium]|nr:MAG: hypothetical protein DCC67_11500 [Planctomycetota bacterium]